MPGTGTIRIDSASRDATVAAGRILGTLLRSGDVVAMDGDLGAGKTTLTAGIAEGIGCMGAVSSPTFVLAMEHEAGTKGLTLHHYDLYRLDSTQDFLQTGLDEAFDADGVCVVEWSEIAGDTLPDNRIGISLHYKGETCRRIEMVFCGPDGPERAERFAGLLCGVTGITPVTEGKDFPL